MLLDMEQKPLVESDQWRYLLLEWLRVEVKT